MLQNGRCPRIVTRSARRPSRTRFSFLLIVCLITKMLMSVVLVLCCACIFLPTNWSASAAHNNPSRLFFDTVRSRGRSPRRPEPPAHVGEHGPAPRSRPGGAARAARPGFACFLASRELSVAGGWGQGRCFCRACSHALCHG